MANSPAGSNSERAQRHERPAGHRNAWILTAYGIFGLGLVCLIAYAVAQYLAS